MEAAVLEGLDAARYFAQGMLGSLDIGDIAPGFNIDSAIGLIGPYRSPAGLNKNGLKNALNAYYDDALDEQIFALSDLGRRFVDKILSRSQLLDGGVIAVLFEDEIIIQVRLESIAVGIGSGPVYMELDVMQQTVRGPGLQSAPVPEGIDRY